MEGGKKMIKSGNHNLVNQKLQQLTDAITKQQSMNASFDGKRGSKDIPHILKYSNSQESMNLIDEIHDETNEKTKKGIPLLGNRVSQWVKRNEDPV